MRSASTGQTSDAGIARCCVGKMLSDPGPIDHRTRCGEDSRRAPMTRLIPDKRCEICGGLLAPAKLLSSPSHETNAAADHELPDYVCIECLQPYYWCDNPPGLVMERDEDQRPRS